MSIKNRYNNIKNVIDSKGLKQIWLSKQLGVTKVTVSRWCSNIQQPPIERLYEIANIINVEVSELLITLEQYRNQKQ